MTKRQKDLLILAIKDYIQTSKPVSSKRLIEGWNLEISSSLIRQELSELEKLKYLQKSSIVSGRIPTNLAYKVYIEEINKDEIQKDTLDKLNKIFEARDLKIGDVIDQSIDLISKVASSITTIEDEPFKSELANIVFLTVDENTSTIVAIFKNGKTISNIVDTSYLSVDEVTISIEIFNKYLKGIQSENLLETAFSLKDIITDVVKGLEGKYQSYVTEIFNKLFDSNYSFKGSNSLIKYHDQYDEKLIEKMLDGVEQNSIWEHLSSSTPLKLENATDIYLDFDNEEFKDLSIITKTLETPSGEKTIRVYGPKNNRYNEILDIFNYLDKKIKQIAPNSEKPKKD